MESEKLSKAFLRLVQIMDELREQCPWDRKQTIQTLRTLSIEELYELADAIIAEDWPGIKEELGDLFLHLLFYARIASEQSKFNLEEVLEGISEKLVARHPHIYGDVKVETEEDVKQNWEKLKLREGKKSVLSGVPVSLPAVVKAIRLQEKSKQVGFEWSSTREVWAKVKEEEKELMEAVQSGDKTHIEEEFGDLMFSLINYARFLSIDAETALERTNRKFIHRFTKMEEAVGKSGKQMAELTLAELDAVWDAVKKQKTTD
ncbi:MAG TPA: nucleoside triphosphate pyrophosphohydrolase [Chitinophagaceae bacterium]|nr:nucleoside triphosphate pyrophosphohydrolase [Chitinophagaceae bacterium]